MEGRRGQSAYMCSPIYYSQVSPRSKKCSLVKRLGLQHVASSIFTSESLHVSDLGGGIYCKLSRVMISLSGFFDCPSSQGAQVILQVALSLLLLLYSCSFLTSFFRWPGSKPLARGEKSLHVSDLRMLHLRIRITFVHFRISDPHIADFHTYLTSSYPQIFASQVSIPSTTASASHVCTFTSQILTPQIVISYILASASHLRIFISQIFISDLYTFTFIFRSS